LRRKILILAAVGTCALAAGCKRAEVAPGPDVWTVVDGHQILRSEVERNYRMQVNPDAPQPSQDEALSVQLHILDEMVNSEILFQRAQKLNLTASDAEVEDKFAETKAPYTEEEFQKRLQQTGLTVDDMKSEIRRELTIARLVNREIVAKISVTDQDVADYYNQNPAQFNHTEPRFHIAQIVITPQTDSNVYNRKNDKARSPAEAARKAAMLQQKLSGGADFSELAMDYSEDTTASSGGDLGWIPESGLEKSDPGLKKAVLSLKPGEVSAPIPAHPGGYFILKLIAKQSAGQQQLSDPQVQEGIRNTLRTRKEQLLRAAYMMEARDEAHVTSYLARQILESSGKLPAAK